MTVRGTRREKQRRNARLRYAAGLALLTATLGQAQVMAPVGIMPDGSRYPVAAAQSGNTAAKSAPSKVPAQTPAAQPNQPAPTAAMQQLHSLKDDPAKPAEIHLTGGKLSVEANNSALDEILNTIAEQSGMKIKGLNRDYRVFGSYGPANPREVLSQLLSDSGFNIVMVGARPDGAPQQLLLTERGDAPVTPPNPNDPEERYQPSPRVVYHAPPMQMRPVQPMHPGPGARNGVKSPQQLLQELEQMQRNQQNSSQ